MYIRVAFGNLANNASYICCDLISFSVPVDANITCFFLDAKKECEIYFLIQRITTKMVLQFIEFV